ncbi:MAG: T9SS type A sorting domain-containing protein [Phaeodactylibacter sp.]|nr:T9SS type A sorting domain-containing protein [Phaeodactylibacter sp.]MCB9049838.1 T9SS type A sorting domain-containing protein [Lewinellaceae bacterium]
MNRTLQLIASVLFLSIQMMAQPLPCFHFEDFPANTQLGPASGNSPGDVLFSQAGIQVSIQEIQYSGGDTGFGNAMVMDASTGWLDGQFLFMGNNSLLFDLSQAAGSFNQLCFDFFDGGGEENFAVNGSAVAVVENFSEIAGLTFPGVAVEVDFSNTNALGRGTVCITGNIESLLVGGQEFGIDNVCPDAVLVCPIDNLRAEVTGCDNAGNYDVLVDFDWLSPLTVITSFDIFVEGGLVATIEQTQLPYLLEGVQIPTDALDFILTVCQNDNPNCCASVVASKQCPQSSCMEFEGLSEPVYGSSAGTPPGVAFYNESDIGLLLIPYQSLFWTTTYGDLVVLDAASAPEMSAASGKYLKFESVNAVFDLTGYPEPVDSVVVDFYYNGGAINLAANGSNILIQNALMPGLYALAPGITLRVVFDSSSGREGQLIFYGNVQSLLIGGAGDFRIDNLCVNPEPEPCRMGNMAIELGPCDSDGNFMATIDFGHQGTSDSFNLSGPGVDGHYAYTDLPVTVGPLMPNNSGIYAFFAADLAQDGCWVGDTIQAAPCTSCAFDGLSIDYLGLSPDGQNVISLGLNLVRPTLTDFFSVYFNGERYERFSWNDVPVRLQVPCNTTDVVQEITVCEGEDHCCVSLPLIYLEPCSGPCSITNVEVEPGSCNPNNVFEVKLNLDYQNTSDSFELWLNGNATGRFFAYADLPVFIGPFVAPTSELEFKAVDVDNPDCSGSATLPAYNCGTPCNSLIDSVAYYLTDCNDEGNYAIVIEQLFPNPPNFDFLFFISVDGVPAGSYSSGSLPIDLGPFPGNGTPHEVAVYRQPTAPCGYRFTTPPVSCNGGCPLQSVHLIGDVQCNDSDFYRAKLAVEGAAAGDVLTITSTVTNFSMTAVYNGDFVVVEMPDTGQFFDNLKVCLPLSTTNVFCCVEVAFDLPCHPCEIFDVHLQPLDCNADGNFFFVVDFEAAGNFGSTFFLMAGDGYNASFQYSDLPVTLGPLPGNGQPVSVWINDESQFCQVDLEMQAPNCSPCPWLSGVTITPNDCRDDGTFTAMLNIVTPAPAIGNLFVVKSGDYIAEFSVADLPVEIGPFPGTGGPREVHVFFPGTDCQATATFITPNCGNGDCIFSSVIAEPHSCDGGQFMVDVEVHVNNPGNLGYYIFADGQIFGPYSYNELFVTIGPFAGDGMEEYGILILDIADPSCFGFTEVGPIDCDAGCEIFDVVVDPLDCNPDGSYNLFLDFEVVHPGNDFFEVFGPNGDLIGYYRLDERPVIVEGIPLTSSGEGHLRVCINDRPGCCREVAYPQPNCGGNCSISDVHAEFAYCDADGNYFVRLSFNFENTDSPGFRVFGNGQDYGTFSYTMPFPVIVGPIAPTGALAYELIVADLGNPDCRSFTTFGAFDCDADTEVCITFDEFETAPNDTINLAFGQPRDSIYDEGGVVFNAVPVPLGNNTNYYEWVVGAAGSACGPMTLDGNLGVNGGVEIHFGHLPALPTTIAFDFTFCNTSTVVPQIVIGANGEVFSGSLTDLPDELPGGIGLEFIPLANSLARGRIILHGPVEHLLIGGHRIFLDNLCFNQPLPTNDDCLSFDVYDGAPSDTLANYGHPDEMEYVEDGVVVTARAIEWNGAANYFTGVYAFENDNCGFGDDDAALSFGGALRFNFAPLSNLPTEITFDLAFCQGQSQNILLVVNGEQYRGSISDLPDMLANVSVMAVSNTLSGNIWTIKLTGTVEAFVIGGSALTIDDVCFNAPQEEEEVWPGDANADNIAHHIDLLNIGLAYGYQGTPRFEDDANWLAFSAGDWPQSFADGTNYKHADCNGDGVVDENDRQVLAQNYGLTHGPLSAPPFLPGTDTDPPVYVDFPAQVPVGTSFNIPIVVGTSRLPMQDVYGIAFTVVFDPVVFPPSAMEVIYPVSWFGEPGINTLSIDRTYAAEGRIEIAITRTDQNNVSGYGPVAHLIGIIDDIAGLKPDTDVAIENIRAISVDEGQIPVQGRSVQFELQYKEDEPKADANGIFSVFPNPTTDWVTVTSKYGYQPEQLSLLTLDGREVKAPQEENRRISLQGLPAGTYILSIRTGGTRVHKLVVKD